MPVFIAKPPTIRPGPPIDRSFSPGLLGAWIATSGSPAAFRDFSGNGLDAAFNGGWQPTPTIGSYGPAWPFDGVSGHYARTTSLALNALEGTLAAVVQFPTSFPYLQSIAANSTSGSPPQAMRLAITPAGGIRFDVGSAVIASAAISTALRGCWVAIVARWNAAGQDILLSGAVVAQGATANGFTPPGSDYLTIGSGVSAPEYTAGIDSIFVASKRWTDAQARRWSADPWWGLRPKPLRMRYAATATAAATLFRRTPGTGRTGSRRVA